MFSSDITNVFDAQQGEDYEMDFESWLNDTANLIQSYNIQYNNNQYKNESYNAPQVPKQEEFSQQSDESSQSTDSDTKSNESQTQAFCNKDDAKKRKNHFGREYVCGRPLSLDIRLAIRDMFQSGAKACAIAAELNITHGCASKILKRYKATGSVEAKKIGGSNPKKSVPAVVEAIIKLKTDEPRLRAWELRDRLIADAVCDMKSIPTHSSINRIIRLHFGRFYLRKKENRQTISLNGVKSDDKTSECNMEDSRGIRRQLSTCSEASETSSNEFWLQSPVSTLEEFFYLPEESSNCEMQNDNDAALSNYNMI